MKALGYVPCSRQNGRAFCPLASCSAINLLQYSRLVSDTSQISSLPAASGRAVHQSLTNSTSTIYFCPHGACYGSQSVSPAQWTYDTWNHVVITIDASGNAYAYINGVQSHQLGLAAVGAGGYPLYLGSWSNDGSNGFEGYMDEVRISNLVRPPDWVATEFNSENAPSTFYSVGGQQ